MYKYSLVLLAASAMLFNGCGEGECCQNISAPIAVIASGALNSGTLSGVGSRDTNADGNIVGYKWTVDGNNVDAGYTLPAGTHEVCLTVTDNDGLTNSTCKSVTINPAKLKPKAKITVDDNNCVAGEEVLVSGDKSSDDGYIVSYAWTPASAWTPDSTAEESGTITCPSSGYSIEVCLTVTDNEGLASDKVCRPITATGPSLQDPIIELSAEGTVAGGFTITCDTIRDQDSIDTDGVSNTYGTDNAIKEIYWQVLYGDGTQTDWNQTAFNIQEPAPYDAGYCGKWVYGNRAGTNITEIKATPVDDEDDNKTYTYRLIEATSAFTLVP